MTIALWLFVIIDVHSKVPQRQARQIGIRVYAAQTLFPDDEKRAALQVDALYAGEVGYLAASIKAVADARVGDTITLKCAACLAGTGERKNIADIARAQ